MSPAHGHQGYIDARKPKETHPRILKQENRASTQSDKWIFVDNEFTQSENLSLVNWNTTETVRVLPGLVGGMNDNE